MKAYIPSDHSETVNCAFITPQLNYCNSLYVGLNQSSLRRLQAEQNAAAHPLTTGTLNTQSHHSSVVLLSPTSFLFQEVVKYFIFIFLVECHGIIVFQNIYTVML